MNQARIAAGVAFDQDVLEYLRRLCQEHQRDRSFIINALVREHARQREDRTRKAEPARLWLTADTAVRGSANLNCAATWRDLLGAPDHQGDISIYGQESNTTTRRLAVMNLALRGFEADFGPEHADTCRRDLHPDLRADTATRVSANPKSRSHLAGLLRSERQLLANPSFNDSDWFRKDDEVRWQFGVPPKGNANFAWVQHFIHHLAPQGMAGVVLAKGSMSSNQSGEGEIRRALIEVDLVSCMVALPGQLFCSTQLPVCLWFVGKNRNASTKRSAFRTAEIQNHPAMGKAHSNFPLN